MLNYNEIVQRKYIIFNEQPYEVLSSHVFRKQQRKPVNQTKLKNLKTGRVVEHSFHQTDKVPEADIETKKITYLYSKKGEHWFCERGDKSARFMLDEKTAGESLAFITEGADVSALLFEDEIIGLKIPKKVDLLVVDAPPAVKGNTAQGATKQITLESGATISAPLFIAEGDTVSVNTETGEYAGRAEKN